MRGERALAPADAAAAGRMRASGEIGPGGTGREKGKGPSGPKSAGAGERKERSHFKIAVEEGGELGAGDGALGQELAVLAGDGQRFQNIAAVGLDGDRHGAARKGVLRADGPFLS